MISSDLRIVRFRETVCLCHLFASIILYCLVFACNLDKYWSLMEAYGFCSIAVFVILLLSELHFKGINLLMLFCVGALMRLAIPTVQMAQDAMDGESFAFFRNYTDYIFQCSVAMNIYYMILIVAMTRFAKDKSLTFNLSVLFGIKHFNLFVSIIYFLGFLARLIPDIISFADTLRAFLSRFPSLALLILAFYCAYTKKRASFILFLSLIVVELWYTIFLGFFKGAIMTPLVTYLIYYYLRNRNEGKSVFNVRFIAYVGAALAFLLVFVYPFMEIKRYESQWDPATNIAYADYNSLEIFNRVLHGEGREGRETGKTTEAASSRQNAIPVNAYFYMTAITDGFQTRIVRTAFQLPIPRWLGGGSRIEDHQGYLGNAWLENGNFVVSKYGIHSAAYAGMFGSAFFWGGWPAAIIMCLFNAWLLTSLLTFTNKNSKNVFALLLLSQILIYGLSCYEEILDGGIKRAIEWGTLALLAIITSRIKNIFHRRNDRKIAL